MNDLQRGLWDELPVPYYIGEKALIMFFRGEMSERICLRER